MNEASVLSRHIPFESSSFFRIMGEPWTDIVAHLRSQRLLAPQSLQERLLNLSDPKSVIEAASALNLSGGMLTASMLDEMIAHAGGEAPPLPVNDVVKQPAEDLARTIAPLSEPEPVDLLLRNNLPDWNEADFSMHASDTSSDITVHYDITGNSTTEGKMTDITACFNDRLQSIRKLIVQNSNLPRKHQEISRLLAEYGRYQGYDNKAVAIGLVNEPRYTKNGHLMWGLEDETGEMTCLLTKRSGEDRDRAHEQILEAGLMPDDVMGVSGTFSQTGDVFYVDDLHFPLETQHRKVSSEAGVSVAFLSDIHVGSKTFLEAQWHKMVRWFHTDPLAKTIKYLILSGDCVDGVGIYPGQDKELAIPDLFAQYSEFARLLELLPAVSYTHLRAHET